MARSGSRARARLGLVVGLLLVTGLVAWEGLDTVLQTMASAGPAILLLSLFHLPFLLLRTVSWRLLFLPGRTPRFPDALRAMWIGNSVNTLLPVATIGGDVVKARLLQAPNARPADCAASLVADKTVQLVTLLVLTLIGMGLLLALGGGGRIVLVAGIGFLLLAAGCAGFVMAQFKGLFGSVTGFAAKVMRGPYWSGLVEAADHFDDTVRAVYRRPGSNAAAVAAQVGAHLLLTGELWYAAALMGHPIGLLEAAMLKTLGGALRGAAFVLPAGLGILEGSTVVLGGLLGHPAPLMLAVSLVTRVRELVAGIPALLAWQRAEQRLMPNRSSAGPSPSDEASAGKS